MVDVNGQKMFCTTAGAVEHARKVCARMCLCALSTGVNKLRYRHMLIHHRDMVFIQRSVQPSYFKVQ